jgi:hypothetical protein
LNSVVVVCIVQQESSYSNDYSHRSVGLVYPNHISTEWDTVHMCSKSKCTH